MRLLTVNMTLDPIGGGSAGRTVQFSRALTELGVQCSIATTVPPQRDPVHDPRLAGIDVQAVRAAAGRFRIPYANLGNVWRAVAQADVVLLMNHWTAINVLVWWAARREGKPWVVCPAGALPLQGRNQPLKRLYNVLFGGRMIRAAAAHVAVTDDERNQFLEYGVDPKRVVTVPNGMPTLPPGDGAAFRSRYQLGTAPVALFVGRLAPVKGPDLLLEAFAAAGDAIRGWRLVFAGPDYGMGPEIDRLVAASPTADRIRQIGFVDGKAKADALAGADLVVVPSRSEAMSIVVLEAAAAGRPVLVTDRCGVPEVETSGGGWVVEASVDGLSRGLIAAESRRADLEAIGRQWQAFAGARYAWPVVGRQLVEVLEQACRSRGGAEARG